MVDIARKDSAMVKRMKQAFIGKSASRRWTIGGEDVIDLLRLGAFAFAIAIISRYTDHADTTVSGIAVVLLETLRRWAADTED